MAPALYRLAISTLLAACLAPAFGRSPDEVQLLQRKDGERLILSASNGLFAPVQVRLSATLKGYRPALPLPVVRVVAAGGAMELQRLEPEEGATRLSASFRLESWVGDPNAKIDTNVACLFPWAHGVRHRVEQGYMGAFSHQGLFAADFDLAEGEAVHAARGGLVIRTESNFTRGGLDPGLTDKANHVDILHDDGSFAEYGHLQYHGTRCKPGDRVKAGDILGHCGFTGYGSAVHLHFQVSRPKALGQADSMPTFFLGRNGPIPMPPEGTWVPSVHPGKAWTNGPSPADLKPETFIPWRASAPADGKLELREERLEDRVAVYLRNGTAETVRLKVTLALTGLEAVGAERTEFVCPAVTEIFLNLYRMKPGSDGFRYQATLEYLP